jgi:PGF-pre-PGF domain-containing protein
MMSSGKNIILVLFIFVVLSASALAANVTTCGTVSVDTNLTADIVNNSGTCFVIGANNVTLNCGGYTIDGDDSASSYGIDVSGKDNVTVENCTITDFNQGMKLLSNADFNYFYNITLTSNTKGIYSAYNNNITLTNITSYNNTEFGIQISQCENYTIRNISVYNNTITGSSNFVIDGKSAITQSTTHSVDRSNMVQGRPVYYLIGNSSETIDLDVLDPGYFSCTSCDNVTIVNGSTATTLQNNGAGVTFADTNNSRLENVTISSNSDGFHIYYSYNNTITNFNITSSVWQGINMRSSENNTFTNSSISSSGEHGIYIYTSHNNTLENNIVSSNTGSGIHINSGQNNTIINNTINSNTLYGSYFQDDLNNVTNNTIQSNVVSAFYFHASEENTTITNNTICYNTAVSTLTPDTTTVLANNTFCVTPTSPESGASSLNTSWNYSVNVSNPINASDTNCTLNPGNSLTANTSTSVTNNGLTTFDYVLTAAAYTWNVSCLDSNGNNGLSSNWLFTVTSCGDNSCNYNENCASCALDCGECTNVPRGSQREEENDTVENETSELEITAVIGNVIDSVVAGEEFKVEVENELKINSIVIVPSEDGTDVKVEIKEYDTAPNNIPVENHTVYQYIEIETDIEIESAEINFEVSNQWLADRGVTSDQVVLLHYEDKWISLETKFVEKDTVNSYFVAKTGSFSVFAVGTGFLEETPEGSMNEFYILFAVMMFLLLLIFGPKVMKK